MKNKCYIFAKSILMAVFLFFCMACQKDDASVPDVGMSTDESGWLFRADTTNETSFSISKKSYWRKSWDEDTCCRVVILGENSEKMYKTVKFANMNKTICQEWLLEDLQTDFFNKYRIIPSNVGPTPGYYYLWEDNFGDADSEVFDAIVRNYDDPENVSESGFHIPTRDDVVTLGKIIKNTSKIPDDLELSYQIVTWDGVRTKMSRFWIDSPDPDKQEGCGVCIQWLSCKNNRMEYGFPNDRNADMKVRLCRTITKQQW